MMRRCVLGLWIFSYGCLSEPDEVLRDSDSGGSTSEESSSTSDSDSATTTATSSTNGTTTTSSSTSGDSTGGSTGTTGEVSYDCAQIIFINFDGVTLTEAGVDDAPNDRTSITSLAIELAPYGGPDRSAIFERIRAIFEAYDVCVVDQRPSADAYTMAVITDTDPGSGFAYQVGVAGHKDCGNQSPNDVVFGLATNAGGWTDLSNAVAFALGVTLGLEGIDPSQIAEAGDEVMAQFLTGVDRWFHDACYPLYSTPTCTSTHTMYCDEGQQNSHQELLGTLGPARTE